jgi:hypothetical protein
MTMTTGKTPIALNQRVGIGGGVQAYFDGVAVWVTFANPINDEMSHISLDSYTFEQLLRFAKVRVGDEFAAAVAKVANEP